MSLRKYYDRHVLPHLINCSMRAPLATHERQQLIPQASGTVLEIGVGSGLNFPHYSNAVDKLYALEPNAKLRQMAQPFANDAPFDVDFLGLKGEDIPLPDQSVDTVVTTWTLCTIADPIKALQGMYRVLKPGGQILFVEHGRAPSPTVARWQDRLTPVWSIGSGGCRLNRRLDLLIQQAGFQLDQLEQGYLDGPKLLTYHYKGLARRA